LSDQGENLKDLPAPKKKDSEMTSMLWGMLAGGLIGGVSVQLGTPLLLAVGEGVLICAVWNRWRCRYLFAAQRAFKAHRFEIALEHSQRAITKDPNMRIGYLYAAAAALQSRQPTSAIEYCNTALAFEPVQPQALQYRASAYLRICDAERALADANEVICLLPNRSLSYLSRASAYVLLHRYSEAIDDCNKLIEGNCYLNLARLTRAAANLGLNKIDDANKDCETVIDQLAVKPSAEELAYALMIKGVIHGRRLQFEEAIVNCTQALELQPAYHSLHIERAHCYCSLGRFQEALLELDILEEKKCSAYVTAFMLSNRARIHLRKGDLEQAVQNAEAATAVFQNIPAILSSYGLVLTRAGQLEKAQIVLDKAISLDPYFAEAYWFRHELYEKMGEPEKAKADKQVADGYDYKPYI
jgi:tetratricopeptide (TPR) repeat protein